MSPAPTTIPALLRHWASERPDKVFLWCGDDRVTYAQADRRSDRIAAGLADLGIGKGDTVAIVAPNRIEMLEIYLGAAKLGAVQVPLNIYLRGEFLRHQLTDSRATTVIVDRDGYGMLTAIREQLDAIERVVLLDEVEVSRDVDTAWATLPYSALRTSTAPLPEVPLTSDDLMSVVYTSGTTGLSKGCMLTHGYYLRVASIPDQLAGLDQDDVLISALPLFHGAARMMIVAGALRKGITAVVEPAFQSSFLERAAETSATVMVGVAAMARALVARAPSKADRAHRLRMGIWAPSDVNLEAEARSRFGIEVTSQSYGQTECACATVGPLDNPAQQGSAGRAASDLEMKIIDDDEEEVAPGEVGEIVFRPRHRHAMFRGYWHRPGETLDALRGLWYHTGDYGRVAEDGSLFFVDRKKDYLRRRGENVSSIELEAAILAHPQVAEVAVHGVPSLQTEDDIKACVVPVDGELLDPGALFKYFQENLPYFAVPRYVEVMSELPKNAMARVMKHVLRDRALSDSTWDFESIGMTVSRAGRRG